MKTIICRKVKHKSSNPKVNCKFRLLLSVSTDSEIHHQFTHIVATNAIHHSHPQDLWLNRIDILCYRIYYANTLSANANCQRVFQKNDTRVFRIRCKLRCTSHPHTHIHTRVVYLCVFMIYDCQRGISMWNCGKKSFRSCTRLALSVIRLIGWCPGYDLKRLLLMSSIFESR